MTESALTKEEMYSALLPGWLIPAGWRIGADGSLTTPMPADGAVGPQNEGSGVTTNKGDAFYQLSDSMLRDGFEITVNFSFVKMETMVT